MIKCKYKKNNDVITYISISGHADYSEFGSDIVCAGVSMLSYTIGNALLNQSDQYDLTVLDNEFIFNDNLKTNESSLLLNTLFDGLLMVEDQYSDYIKIEEV